MSANLNTACFIDTNIWLYAFIEADDQKKSANARFVASTELSKHQKII